MIFSEFRFFIFFAIVFSIYWILSKNSSRKVWLLLCSYAFYAAWDWRFLSLILASTTIDYAVGVMISKTVNPRYRKGWLMLSLCSNLGFLGFFKYYNFFADSAASFMTFLGLQVQSHTLEIILPVGISFYTFQTLSYSIDVYWGRLKAVESFLDLAVYVSFFPQLVAGPIVRASTFLPQLHTARKFSKIDFRYFLIIFLVGFIKKACIADNLAPLVDRYFTNPETYTAMSSWLGVVSYTVQIYCDFSGYSDMAIATAGLLGYELCLNFDFPYFATNITSFWRRWHISLSSWLRDYLYIPLGGNRGTKLFTYKNLMLTMVLGGLWHGAAWNFVIWGGLHGTALIAHREWSRLTYSYKQLQILRNLMGLLLTFYWVCVTWIFFRAVDLKTAMTILKSFVLLDSSGSIDMGIGLLWIFVPLTIAHWFAYRGLFSDLWRRIPGWSFAAFYGLAFSAILPFVSTSYTPFIYFQF
ncbi:MAG: MBOAT family O-acyltransferase [Planktothrix sp.]